MRAALKLNSIAFQLLNVRRRYVLRVARIIVDALEKDQLLATMHQCRNKCKVGLINKGQCWTFLLKPIDENVAANFLEYSSDRLYCLGHVLPSQEVGRNFSSFTASNNS